MLLLHTDTIALLLHIGNSTLLHDIIATESFNICSRQREMRCSCSNVSLSIHEHAPLSQYVHDEPRNSIPHRQRGSTHAANCRAEVYELLIYIQAGTADASAFQLTTHPNVNRLSAASRKKISSQGAVKRNGAFSNSALFCQRTVPLVDLSTREISRGETS